MASENLAALALHHLEFASTALRALTMIDLPQRRIEMAPGFDEYEQRIAKIIERASRQTVAQAQTAAEHAAIEARTKDRRAAARADARKFADQIKGDAESLSIYLKASGISIDAAEREPGAGDRPDLIDTVVVRLYRDGRDTETRLEIEIDEDRKARQIWPKGQHEGLKEISKIDVNGMLLKFVEICSDLPT